MAQNRRKLNAGLAAFVAFSLFVCVATGGASARAPGRQVAFTFTPHVTDVGATAIPGAAPIPTPGPGQYFEEDDPNRPEVLREAGDDSYGYGPLASNPDLYAVWVTDGSGTHYYIVDGDSDLIWGDADPLGGRRDNGLDDIIGARSSLLAQIAELVAARESRENTSRNLFWTGVGGLLVATACVAATLGACGIFAGLAAPFLVGGFVAQGSANEADAQINALADQLHGVEDLIRNRFALGLAGASAP